MPEYKCGGFSMAGCADYFCEACEDSIMISEESYQETKARVEADEKRSQELEDQQRLADQFPCQGSINEDISTNRGEQQGTDRPELYCLHQV